MKTAYYETYKLKSDFEKAENGNIDDFEKYPIYRAIQFFWDKKEAIYKLCIGLPELMGIEDGEWIVEFPKMKEDKIIYDIYTDKGFHIRFQKYNASGVLGCGEGSERFAKGKI